MEEWDPEHFTSFEHLCEVTLSAVREKQRLNRSICGCVLRRPSSITIARNRVCSA